MTTTALTTARTIERPTREAMLRRAPSVSQFWVENRNLLEDAWKEWESAEIGASGPFDSRLYDARLQRAVEDAWADPQKESRVKALWEEVFPGVYQAQFFDPEHLVTLRDYWQRVAESEIPLRPPYGISLNRGGALLDKRSEGYLAAPGFQAFYQDLMSRYMRPIARMLFPDIAGYDSQTFGFSIQWQPDTDTSLRAHTRYREPEKLGRFGHEGTGNKLKNEA